MHIVYTLTQFAALINSKDVGLPQTEVTQGSISTALQIVFGFAGGIAVLIITIAGFRYITSQGKPQEVAKAKDTIIYAIVGLVVCMTAFSIVKFVISRT